MATLSIQDIDRDGLEASYDACAAGGDEFINDGKRTFVHVKNGHTSPQTVKFTIQQTVDGEVVGTKDVEVTNAEDRMIGPFPANIYNDADGKVQITYSGVTSLTIAVCKL